MTLRNANKRIPMCHRSLICSKGKYGIDSYHSNCSWHHKVARKMTKKIEVKGISQRTINVEESILVHIICVSVYPLFLKVEQRQFQDICVPLMRAQHLKHQVPMWCQFNGAAVTNTTDRWLIHNHILFLTGLEAETVEVLVNSKSGEVLLPGSKWQAGPVPRVDGGGALGGSSYSGTNPIHKGSPWKGPSCKYHYIGL